MREFWFLKKEAILTLSYGARATYIVVLSASRHIPFAKGISIFELIPSSTYYRHRKEILGKTGLDLNSFFPAAKPVSRSWSLML
jgi:hypothetical protein